MKSIIKKILIVSLIVYYSNTFAQDKSYSVAVTIKGMPDGTTFYLIRSNKWHKADTIKKVKIKNEHLVFKGSSEVNGEMHFIKMDTSKVKLPKSLETGTNSKMNWTSFMLDNTDITINSTIHLWPEVVIVGSIETKKYKETISLISKRIEKANVEVKKLRHDTARINEINQKLTERLFTDLINEPNSYATPFITLKIGQFDSSKKQQIYNALDGRIKKSFYGIKLKEDISNLKIRETIAEGKIVPNFEFETSEGKTLSILELAAKSKLTLVDFWASWCSPCRAEIPNLKKVYADFKSQGFNIVGLSGDEKEAAWRKSLLEENMPWFQVIAKNVRVGKDIFGLSSIPAYLLIDQKGRMIAFERGVGTVPAFGPDIRGEELKDTLAKLLKSM